MPATSICRASSLEPRSGAKPPSSPPPVPRPRSCSVFFSAWKTSAPVRSASRERRRADRHDHELLEVDLVVGVRAAVEDVHHRHGQDVRRVAAEVAPQRQPLLGRRRVGGGERHAEDRVRAEARLVRRAVEVDQRAVEALLVGRVAARDRLGDLAVDVADRLRHALAAERRAAVAQLGRLELAGGCAARHRGAPGRAGAQRELDLDGRVAAAVEDLAGVDLLDVAHGDSFQLRLGVEARACASAAGRPSRGRRRRRARSASCDPPAEPARSRTGARAPGRRASLRATLTAANRTSPTSWKRARRGRPLRRLAARLELAARLDAAAGPRAGSRSPADAARRCTLRACSSAGQVLGDVAEDAALAAGLVALDRVPVAQHLAGASRPRCRRTRAGGGG